MRAANHVSVSQACRAAARELRTLKCQLCGESSTYMLVVTFHGQADATKKPNSAAINTKCDCVAVKVQEGSLNMHQDRQICYAEGMPGCRTGTPSR